MWQQESWSVVRHGHKSCSEKFVQVGCEAGWSVEAGACGGGSEYGGGQEMVCHYDKI